MTSSWCLRMRLNAQELSPETMYRLKILATIQEECRE